MIRKCMFSYANKRQSAGQGTVEHMIYSVQINAIDRYIFCYSRHTIYSGSQEKVPPPMDAAVSGLTVLEMFENEPRCEKTGLRGF